MRRAAFLLALCFLSMPASAGKQLISWKNPVANTDGTALTNLASIRVEWGTCFGTDFGLLQASILYTPAQAAGAPIYPTGMTTYCVRAYAISATGAESGPSNVLVVTSLPTTGKPVTLGQPITLPE